jgi:PIN domain nuclease of toxin-antitoxin system
VLVASARDAIADPRNEVAFSAGSIWEISIKRAIGKLRVRPDLIDVLIARRFLPLPITVEHALAAAELPLHHPDPFDRMLIVQAQLEGRTIVTRDREFAAYDVALLPA